MDIRVRCDKNNRWGFVEEYKVYDYLGKGSVNALVGVGFDRSMTEPYVFRGGSFIRLEEIDKEMGIEKYVKAKKPFYTLLKDGFIVKLDAKVDFINKEYFPEKSSYSVYTPLKISKEGCSATKLVLMRVNEIPVEMDGSMRCLLQEVGGSMGDRETFLRGRMKRG